MWPINSAGDRVCRGPDWEGGEGDGGSGQLGTVIALTNWETAEGRGIQVRWDHDPSTVQTYRWGYLGKYDVTVSRRDESGLLLLKGNEALLSPPEQTGSWTSFGLSLKDDASVEHFIAGGGEEVYAMEGRSRLPAGEWAHVAVVQAGPSLRLFVNGKGDAELKLPPHMVKPSRYKDM